MKNIKYSALVAIAAIAASCAKESTVIEKETIKDIPMEPMCIQTGDESETKTSLNGQTVNWTEGDQIAVYSNMDYSTGYKFSATNINDINRNTATFSGEVPAGTESFFAVYPPERVSSASASGAVVTIPSDQTPAAGTFGEELNITIAKGTKKPGTPNVGTIRFRNVCSYVKFTVPAYVSDVNSVTISSDNAIAGNLTVNYTEKDPSSTIAANGEKFISMSGSFGAGKTFIFVIAPGTVSNFRIDIETASGNWTRTIRDGFDAIAGKPVNLGTVDFKIASMKATATHTYEGEGETKTLTGTNLVIDNLNIPDGLTGYVKKVHIDIIPEGKTKAVRWADITDFSNQTSIAVAGNSKEYPYLPQGNYTIKSTYTMSDGTTSRETTGSFPVPAPTFTVNTPSAHTSYDTYKNSGATAANDESGTTIYGITNNGVTISSDILTKYASLSSGYSYTIDGNAASAGDNANQSWAAHEVAAKFTFDRVTNTSSALTCYVTGLPFVDSNITGDYSGWTTSNASISSGAITLSCKASASNCGYLISPKIETPESIDVLVTVNAKSSASLSSSLSNLYIGSTDSNTEAHSKNSISINKNAKDYNQSFSVQNAYISFRAAAIRGLTQTISSLSIQYK